MIILLLALSSILIFASPTNPIFCIIAIAFSYPALIILTYKLKKKVHRGAFLYLFGLLYLLYQMRWMGLGAYHGSIIMLAYALLAVIFPWNYFLVGYFLPKKIENLNVLSITMLAFMFSAIEYSRLFMLSGFPFHQAGMVYASNIFTLQLASIVGVFGLSFILLVQCLYMAKFMEAGSFPRVVCSFVLPFVLGAFLYFTPDLGKKDIERVSIGLVQPGFLVEQKWEFPDMHDKALTSAKQLSIIWKNMKNVLSADLIILPENVIGGDIQTKQFLFQDIEHLFPEDFFKSTDQLLFSTFDIMTLISKYYQKDIIFGGCEHRYTSAFFLHDGALQNRYNKKRLVPFGEYIPLGFDGLFRDYGGNAQFLSGKSKTVFSGNVKILPSICFDEGYPDDFLALNSFHPDIHVNISNDAWFAFLNLLDAHYFLGILRSVENGLFSFRCSNNGISCIISPKGEVLSKLKESSDGKNLLSGSILFSAKIYKKLTIFSVIGNGGLLVCFSIFSLLNLLRSKNTLFLKA